MNYLVDQKILLFNNFNSRLNNFSYCRIDSKNKIPLQIFTEYALKTGKGFKLSATHFSTLIKVFPIIFGEELKDYEHYNHYIDLIEIYFFLNDDSFNELKLQFLEKKIYNYLNSFKFLYPDQILPAKFHFMIHYPRCIKRFGPPRQYSTIRFESKHSFFKRADHAIHNHINLTRSLSYKHQDLQLFYLRSPFYFSQNIFGTHEIISFDNYNIIKELIGLNNIQFYKWVEFNNVKYCLGDMICLNSSFENQIPVFGKIKHLIVSNLKLSFLFDRYTTIEFIKHHMGFSVKEELNSAKYCFDLDNLKNIFPNSFYITSSGNEIVILKYPFK